MNPFTPPPPSKKSHNSLPPPTNHHSHWVMNALQFCTRQKPPVGGRPKTWCGPFGDCSMVSVCLGKDCTSSQLSSSWERSCSSTSTWGGKELRVAQWGTQGTIIRENEQFCTSWNFDHMNIFSDTNEFSNGVCVCCSPKEIKNTMQQYSVRWSNSVVGCFIEIGKILWFRDKGLLSTKKIFKHVPNRALRDIIEQYLLDHPEVCQRAIIAKAVNELFACENVPQCKQFDGSQSENKMRGIWVTELTLIGESADQKKGLLY